VRQAGAKGLHLFVPAVLNKAQQQLPQVRETQLDLSGSTLACGTKGALHCAWLDLYGWTRLKFSVITFLHGWHSTQEVMQLW
jgi:hypothetical protein